MLALRRRGLLAVAAMLVGVLTARPARADEIHDCVEAANAGQSLRDAGKLGAARKAFVTCSADACPSVVRDSCRRWDAEVEPRLSTVTFAASSTTGEDLAEVRVSVDGRVVTDRLDGRPIALDPGSHDVVFEAKGFSPWKQLVVVREAEKARLVAARLGRPALATTELPALPRRNLAPLVATGSVAAAGLTGFAVFGLVGKNDHDHLASTCAPTETCHAADVNAARNAWIAADVSLAVGIVGAGLFTAIAVAPLIRGPRSKPNPGGPTAFVSPTLRGATLGLRSSF